MHKHTLAHSAKLTPAASHSRAHLFLRTRSRSHILVRAHANAHIQNSPTHQAKDAEIGAEQADAKKDAASANSEKKEAKIGLYLVLKMRVEKLVNSNTWQTIR